MKNKKNKLMSRLRKNTNMQIFIIIVIVNIIQVIYAANMYSIYIKGITHHNTQSNPYDPVFSAFTLWIGGNHVSVFSNIFYLFPFIIPLSLKYRTEIDLNIKEYVSNYFTAFWATGFTVFIPLLCNFMIIMLLFPAIYPDSIYDIYYGIFSNSFMGELFYTMPFIYIAIFLVLNHIFYGLLGGLCYTLYQLTKRKLFSLCIPPLFPLTLHLVEYFQKGVVMENNQELSPMIYLNPACSRHTGWLIITTEYSILFLITVILFVVIVKLHRKKGNGA